MTRDAKLLRRAFFNRDPRAVARELLGKLIVRREGRKQLAGRIVEVEAYLGAGDLAAHAAAGQHRAQLLCSGDLLGTPMFTSFMACITA